MNENLKYGLFFLGGVTLGVVGAVAVSRGKLDIKPFATELLSRGMDMSGGKTKPDVEYGAELFPANVQRRSCGAAR